MKRIAITAPQTAELLDIPEAEEAVPSKHVRGRTLVSLVSPGTEIHWAFLSKQFPVFPGYSCVFQVEKLAEDVSEVRVGDLVLFSGGHGEFQQAAVESVVKVPANLAPETAVFARLMGVSMSTLNTTTIRPPERVLITGLGPIGNLAAQIFSLCGYPVTAFDPIEERRNLATEFGIRDVRALPSEARDLVDRIGLHVECSGHEGAVLDGCRLIRKRGEISLVGVPWHKRTELSAFDLLHAVFHRYVNLRSGWEWEVPKLPTPFIGNSIAENYRIALQWLSEGRIKTSGLATRFSPSQAQTAYEGLLKSSLSTPGVYFDWRG